MEITIGSYKMRVEILILIVIVSWIMFGHMLCGCSNVSFMEGMELLKEGMSKQKPASALAMPAVSSNVAAFTQMNDMDVSTITNSLKHASIKEAFTGSNNTATGPQFAEARSADYIMNPNTWSKPTLTYSPGTKPDAGVQSLLNRPKQPIPLPEGELDMFATTEFKPECCPNAYSSSTGCACMTMGQYDYLHLRGGNNVPYSEY